MFFELLGKTRNCEYVCLSKSSAIQQTIFAQWKWQTNDAVLTVVVGSSNNGKTMAVKLLIAIKLQTKFSTAFVDWTIKWMNESENLLKDHWW